METVYRKFRIGGKITKSIHNKENVKNYFHKSNVCILCFKTE